MKPWIDRLKAACDAGYYRTEAAEGDQTRFPWQNKTCQDCPFWTSGICQVHAEHRASTAHTCAYFDPWNRERARTIMQERHWELTRIWWRWFNDHGAPRWVGPAAGLRLTHVR